MTEPVAEEVHAQSVQSILWLFDVFKHPIALNAPVTITICCQISLLCSSTARAVARQNALQLATALLARPDLCELRVLTQLCLSSRDGATSTCSPMQAEAATQLYAA